MDTFSLAYRMALADAKEENTQFVQIRNILAK